MKITVQQTKLARAMNYITKAASSKPNIPVLSNVLLQVKKGTLQLSSTNLDMGLNLWIAGNIESEGEITVSAKIFADFVNASGKGKVTLELIKNVLKVTTEKSEAEFQTIAADEFPVLPKVMGEALLSVVAHDFAKSLEKVIFACSTDTSPGKSQQTGVFFELATDDNILKLVGLDGYRLSEKKLKVKRGSADKFEAIVPAKSLQELAKVIQAEDDAENVEMYVNDSNSQNNV